MAMAEKVEEYIWGKIDENDYLGKIVASESFEAEKLLSKVEAVQCNINLQLRRGVEGEVI
jgi:hypothetical protein